MYRSPDIYLTFKKIPETSDEDNATSHRLKSGPLRSHSSSGRENDGENEKIRRGIFLLTCYIEIIEGSYIDHQWERNFWLEYGISAIK